MNVEIEMSNGHGAPDRLKAAAEALAACCRESREEEGLASLYHPDAVSVEPTIMPGGDRREWRGVEAIREKHAWWAANMDVHDAKVDGPMYHGDDRFGLIFSTDVTDKNSGERMQFTEFGVYTIDEDGKIVREEFFFSY